MCPHIILSFLIGVWKMESWHHTNFFPDRMSPEEVSATVDEAWKWCGKKGITPVYRPRIELYELTGEVSLDVHVRLYFNKHGEIVSAFPVFGAME